MCLYIKAGEHYDSKQKTYYSKTATEDIFIYKVLKKYKGEWFSPYYPKRYRKNILYKTKKFYKKTNYPDIKEGFHSFQYDEYGKLSAINLQNLFFESREIFKAMIPKGSLYWSGLENDLCSNQIMILEKIKNA